MNIWTSFTSFLALKPNGSSICSFQRLHSNRIPTNTIAINSTVRSFNCLEFYDLTLQCHQHFSVLCRSDKAFALLKLGSTPPPATYLSFPNSKDELHAKAIVNHWIFFSFIYWMDSCPNDIKRQHHQPILKSQMFCNFSLS